MKKKHPVSTHKGFNVSNGDTPFLDQSIYSPPTNMLFLITVLVTLQYQNGNQITFPRAENHHSIRSKCHETKLYLHLKLIPKVRLKLLVFNWDCSV